MEFRVLDIFCGAGSISCGLEQNPKFKTVLASDFNKFAIETFKKNHSECETLIGDITDKELKNKIIERAKNLKVNMIVGVPPCQGFSNKEKKLGLNDPRNYLFLEYIELVDKIRPKVFIIENVKNMISCANGYFINQITDKFQEMGYNVSYKVLNSYDFGVPQTRERTIIIGALDFCFDFNDLYLEDYLKTTVYDAISDLNYHESSTGNFCEDYKKEAMTNYQKILRTSEKLYNHTETKHSKISIEKLKIIASEKEKEYSHGNQKFKTTWRRLVWNEPSPTIDTRFDTKNSHPELHRAITTREAARIQSFPDDYVFYGTKTEICKQIGNAVPPLLAKALGKSIVRQSNLFLKQYIENDYKIYNANANYMIEYFLKNNIKVNHIITDPPYLISKKNNFSTMNSAKRKGVNFGIWDKSFNLISWIKKFLKIIDENGSIIIFCSYRHISYIVDELEKNNFNVKDIIEWKKTNPMPRNIERRYVQDTEFAIWAVNKKAKWIFNKPKNAKYLKSTFTTSVVSGKEKTKHPTQKSLALMEELIKIHTNENDLILDPFMGSGTTGVACIKNNRNFIGVEISKEYFDIAKKRLENKF